MRPATPWRVVFVLAVTIVLMLVAMRMLGYDLENLPLEQIAQAETAVDLDAITVSPEVLPSGKLNVSRSDIDLLNCQHERNGWREIVVDQERQIVRLRLALQRHVEGT